MGTLCEEGRDAAEQGLSLPRQVLGVCHRVGTQSRPLLMVQTQLCPGEDTAVLGAHCISCLPAAELTLLLWEGTAPAEGSGRTRCLSAAHLLGKAMVCQGIEATVALS